jgi:hypothetical protein
VLTIPGSRTAQREDLYIEHRPAAAKTPRRVGRNLNILERAVRDGDRSSRTMFYLANELRDAGRDSDAIEAYDEYLDDLVSPGRNTPRAWSQCRNRMCPSNARQTTAGRTGR